MIKWHCNTKSPVFDICTKCTFLYLPPVLIIIHQASIVHLSPVNFLTLIGIEFPDFLIRIFPVLPGNSRIKSGPLLHVRHECLLQHSNTTMLVTEHKKVLELLQIF